jgi:hypothetical protein
MSISTEISSTFLGIVGWILTGGVANSGGRSDIKTMSSLLRAMPIACVIGYLSGFFFTWKENLKNKIA